MPISTKYLFSVKCIVFSKFDMNIYANIQSSFHSLWSWKYGTTMGASTLQYSTTACFDTYPMTVLNDLGFVENLLTQILKFQEEKKCGLTEIFNEIHDDKKADDSSLKSLR